MEPSIAQQEGSEALPQGQRAVGERRVPEEWGLFRLRGARKISFSSFIGQHVLNICSGLSMTRGTGGMQKNPGQG